MRRSKKDSKNWKQSLPQATPHQKCSTNIQASLQNLKKRWGLGNKHNKISKTCLINNSRSQKPQKQEANRSSLSLIKRLFNWEDSNHLLTNLRNGKNINHDKNIRADHDNIGIRHGIDLSNLDNDVNPSENFYKYACGGWMKKHPLTAEYSRFGTFDLLRENAREQLKDLIINLEHNPDSKVKGTDAQKVCDLYRMGMDSERLNREGAAPCALSSTKSCNRNRKTSRSYCRGFTTAYAIPFCNRSRCRFQRLRPQYHAYRGSRPRAR